MEDNLPARPCSRIPVKPIIELIDNRLLEACHDISDGGLIVTISEMLLGWKGEGVIGAKLYFKDKLRADKFLFSESPGFVFEASEDNIDGIKDICRKYNVELNEIGKTINKDKLSVDFNKNRLIDVKINELKEAWVNGFKEAVK